MNWKHLLLFPMAAICAGHSASPPQHRAKIPSMPATDCAYEAARKNYLFAYAQAENSLEKKKAFCLRAANAISRCGHEAHILRERISDLCGN